MHAVKARAAEQCGRERQKIAYFQFLPKEAAKEIW